MDNMDKHLIKGFLISTAIVILIALYVIYANDANSIKYEAYCQKFGSEWHLSERSQSICVNDKGDIKYI